MPAFFIRVVFLTVSFVSVVYAIIGLKSLLKYSSPFNSVMFYSSLFLTCLLLFVSVAAFLLSRDKD